MFVFALCPQAKAQEGTGRGGGNPIIFNLHILYPELSDCEIVEVLREQAIEQGTKVKNRDLDYYDESIQGLVEYCDPENFKNRR